MDPKTLREEVIRPKLVELFGSTVANTILTDSILAGMAGSTEQEKLKLILESVCSDHKVVSMLGAAQLQRQKQEWMQWVE
jgi:hypothetical protein